MKSVFLLLLGAISLLAESLQLVSDFSPRSAQPFMQVLIDENRSLNFEQAMQSHFTPMERTNLQRKDVQIWTRLSLENPTSQPVSLILQNPRAGVDYLDVHLLQNRIWTHYEMGDLRPIENRPIAHRYTIVPLRLAPGEQITVLSRIESYGPLELNWIVHPSDQFFGESVLESMIWGLFGGLIIALVVYNAALYVSLKDAAILAYILHGVFAFCQQYAVTGIFYSLDLGINLEFITFSTWVTGYLGPAMFYIFAVLFLKTWESHRFIHWYLVGLIGFYIAHGIFFALAAVIDPDGLLRYSGSPVLFLLLFIPSIIALGLITWVGLSKQVSGGKYYLLGQSSYAIGYIYFILANMGFAPTGWLSNNSVAIGTFLDMVFFSVALGSRIRAIREERDSQEKLLAEQSRFASIGQAVGNIAHQWRKPITHLGAKITLLESKIFDTPAYAQFEPDIREMEKDLEFMTETVREFYDFYRTDTVPVNFSPREKIESITHMLAPQTEKWKMDFSLDIEPDFTMHGYPFAFGHLILILIENTLDMFETRTNTQPIIKIAMSQTESNATVLVYEDHAGGITAKPIEQIFQLRYSEGKKTGSGFGLAMLKRIVEGRFNGAVRVENTEDGAKFTLFFRQHPV